MYRIEFTEYAKKIMLKLDKSARLKIYHKLEEAKK